MHSWIQKPLVISSLYYSTNTLDQLRREKQVNGVKTNITEEARLSYHQPPSPYNLSTNRNMCWNSCCNGRSFSSNSALLRHKREKAGTAQRFLCALCSRDFSRSKARENHMISKHKSGDLTIKDAVASTTNSTPETTTNVFHFASAADIKAIERIYDGFMKFGVKNQALQEALEQIKKHASSTQGMRKTLAAGRKKVQHREAQSKSLRLTTDLYHC